MFIATHPERKGERGRRGERECVCFEEVTERKKNEEDRKIKREREREREDWTVDREKVEKNEVY